jgi:hypothetical protein
VTTASEKPFEQDTEGAKAKSMCRHKQRFSHKLQYTIAELSRQSVGYGLQVRTAKHPKF